MKILKLLLAVMLIGVMAIPVSTVFAQETKNSEGIVLEANAQQLEIIRDIWGKSISVAEYFKIVYPNEFDTLLKTIPVDSRKYLYEMQWQWPSIPKLPAIESALVPDCDSSISLHGNSTDSIVDVLMYTAPPSVPGSGRVNHGAMVITSPSTTMTYLSFTSYLWFYGNGEELKNSFTKWGVLVSSLNSAQDFYTTEDGLYCNVTSCSFISPPGYTPVSGTFPGGSGWWWLTP